MRQVFEDIQAGELVEALERKGLTTQRLRVVVETIEAEPIDMAEIAQAGGAFDWLRDEPELYSDADLIDRYRV